ncbi:MAG TPA: hypothetical protein VGK10_05895 [Prolixibacteraceae bacterium]
MKTISKLTMLFAFVAFANTLMASGNLKVNIVPLTSEKAVIAISNTTASNFQITIENENGETVYYKETGSESKDYRKVFDFSNLESGAYKLTASIDGATTERSFSIDKRQIAVGKEKVSLEPYFAYKEGILALSFLNFSQESMVLNFYDRNNELVFTKEIGDSFDVNKGFDLSKLANGEYSVVLSTENRNYTYNVNVE